jgi:hypothetical protein
MASMGIVEKLKSFLSDHTVLCLFLLILIVYNLNFRPISSGDTVPASLFPFSVLEYHDIFFDHYVQDLRDMGTLTYFFWNMRGHSVSAYPIITPVLIIPLYVIPYMFLKAFGIPIDLSSVYFIIAVNFMEKLSASIISALASVFVYLSLMELLKNKKVSLLVALIFAFATNTWAVSGQALWQHGMVELMLSAIVYLVIIDIKKQNARNVVLIGVLSGLFVFNRPSDGLLLLPVLVYILSLRDRRVFAYLASVLCASLPFIAYNYYFFGSLMGGYSSITLFSFNSGTIVNMLGMLISPSRGLIIYSPVVLLALPGLWNVRKIDDSRIRRFLYLAFVAVLLEVAVYGSFNTWWAGWSYGPRFLTGALPYLAILIALSLPGEISLKSLNKKQALTVFMLALLLIPSVFSQVIGAFYYPNGSWDADPNVDANNWRLWDWSDTQMKRSFDAGPIYPPGLVIIGKHIISAL